MGNAGAASETYLQSRLQRRIWREWAWTLACLLALSFSLSYFSDALGLKRLENTLYDRFVSTLIQEAASDNIVIVAIDDSSIETIGFWPWQRAWHAQILAPLSGARAVALDLLLSEPNPAYPDDDAFLAAAMRSHGRVVLPLMIDAERKQVVYPLPELQEGAAGLGYINIDPDLDGAIRAFSPQMQINGARSMQHLVTTLLDVGDAQQEAQRLHSYGTRKLRIPYTGPPGGFTIYPYSSVVQGKVAATAFDEKFVLIGSWGSGLGDVFPTPHSGAGAAMSGVEILANILNSGMSDRWIHTPAVWLSALLGLVPVLLSYLSFLYLSPQRSFVFSVVLFVATFVASALILRYTLWWWSPVGSLIGLTLAYPVWSWRSQHAALRHIDDELALLSGEHSVSTQHAAQRHGGGASHNRSLPLWNQSLLARIGQLHHALEALRIAQRQRNETQRFLSHDMRAPLNSILALTQLQRREPQRQITDRVLDRLDHYARQTLALVDGFIDLSRAAAVALHTRCINLSEIMMQCCDDAWVRARQKDIRILYDDLPDHAWVDADAQLLERAFSNLLDNAVKYSAPHTCVQCSILSDGGEWLIEIRDQGRGMSADAIAHAFTPFVRMTDDHPDAPPGAGLGLAFVQTVIQRHGGRIELESTPGQGTRFRIRLKKSII